MRHVLTGLLVAVVVAGCGDAGGARVLDRKAAVTISTTTQPTNAVWLDDLDLSVVDDRTGSAGKCKNIVGKPISLAGQTYLRGVGTHAPSEIVVDLHGAAKHFHAVVGIDDEVGKLGSAVFSVWVDDREAARTVVLRGGAVPRVISVDLSSAKRLWLVVEDGGDGMDKDHSDWAMAWIEMVPGAPINSGGLSTTHPTSAPTATTHPRTAKPQTVRIADNAPPAIAFVKPGDHLTSVPTIHAPYVVGATPGRPFLFRIPTTGAGPMRFTADRLPAGLKLDANAGIISGTLKERGRTDTLITAQGALGRTSATLTIIGVEHRLAQTPPMGWNSWNVWGTSVDEAKVQAAADAMEASGLAARGFSYVNIDDAWEGTRDAQGRIRTNEKFPDMRALAGHLHRKGLKLGIYSSPGPKTCAGYEGSKDHELDDARAYAEWGIDLLKYDWCSYGPISNDTPRDTLRRPYEVMRAALDVCGRDIVYSICQYGRGRVWEWGAEVGGNYWRTTGDIVDTWACMSAIGFAEHDHASHSRPGHWNDPDMLVVGRLGWGPTLHATRLTPNEQMTHITLWSLLAAPMLIGCDLTQLDELTLSLLANAEVLAINQDALGQQARRVAQSGTRRFGPKADMTEVWSRPLVDGSIAVGLFNRGATEATVTARWAALGLRGPHSVRNVWQHQDEGVVNAAYTAKLPRHGAVFVRLTPASKR